MTGARELLGYVMGALFVSVAILMMGLAWIGLEAAFGWQAAVILLVASLLVRVNLFIVAGAYYFAQQVWGFAPIEAAVFALPALMFVTPSVTLPLFGAISRPLKN